MRSTLPERFPRVPPYRLHPQAALPAPAQRASAARWASSARRAAQHGSAAQRARPPAGLTNLTGQSATLYLSMCDNLLSGTLPAAWTAASSVLLPPYVSLSYNPYLFGPAPTASAVVIWTAHCGYNYLGSSIGLPRRAAAAAGPP